MMDRGGLSRRSILKRAGFVLAGAAASTIAAQQPASAAPVCCYLRYQPGTSGYCKGNGSGGFVCSGTGYHFRAWYCCTGSRTYACAECTTNSTCSGPTIKCSAYWTVSPNSCTTRIAADKLVARMDPVDAKAWATRPWAPPATPEELASASYGVASVQATRPSTH